MGWGVIYPGGSYLRSAVAFSATELPQNLMADTGCLCLLDFDDINISIFLREIEVDFGTPVEVSGVPFLDAFKSMISLFFRL